MSDRISQPAKRGARLAVVVSLLVAFGALGAVPAAADDRSETHCVVDVVDVVDGELVTGTPMCSNNVGAALHRATGGTWRLPADATLGGDSLETPMGATLTLARHYSGSYGSGSSITIIGVTCSGSFWNTPSWWDNRISSTYNYCYRTRHYDNPYMSGSSALLSGSYRLHNISGFMNNRTESVRYYSS